MKSEINRSMDEDQETLLSTLMSRKRPLESASPDPDGDECLPKKSNLSESESEAINIKVMLPTQVTGAIIGKGGEAIGKVQSDTGCRVKMTKSNDFFPGTTERVAWINGPVDAVLKVMAYFCEKNAAKTDASIKGDIFDYKQTERSKEIKLVIPSSSAGMVIGKAGEYIKSIRETTGAFAQMSGKDLVDARLQERVVTIVGRNAGDPSDMLNAVRMVLDKVSTDVNSTKAPYTNLSYVHLTASKLAATLSTLAAAAAARPNSPRSVASSLLYHTHQPSFVQQNPKSQSLPFLHPVA
uniref:K Homology domain-containing protein n=1 Tax=Romanomermis culicivorax TaxID=13658 RepID=A0A915HIC0_ROMCU